MQYGNRRSGSTTAASKHQVTAYTPFRPDGCHPVDGCQDGDAVLRLGLPVPRGERRRQEDTGNPLLPAYEIKTTSTNEKIAFIGETLEGTPLVVTPSGVAGLDFLDEADTVNALVPKLKKRGVETIVLLLHQGGFQNPPPASQGGFPTSNACENFNGPDLVDVVNRLDPEIDVVVSAHTHAPYICTINGRLVTSAASFGRLITRDRPDDRPAHGAMSSRRPRQQHVVTQNVAKDAGPRPRCWRGTRRSPTRSRTASSARSRPTSVGTRHPERPGRRRRAADGRRDRGRPARSDAADATSAAPWSRS